MKCWCLSGSVRLWFLVSLSGCLSAVVIEPGWAEIKSTVEKQEVQSQENFKPLLSRKIRQLSEIERPSTSAIMLVQSPATEAAPSSEVVQVTAVKANPTDKGVEVILQTTQGEKLQITNRSADNNFIADIPNAQLRLPSGDGFTFRSQNPVQGITEITVTNLDANIIRVTVTGDAGLPTVELFDSNEGFILGLTPAATAMQPPQQPEAKKPTSETPQEEPAAQQDEPIELVVTGEQDGYNVPNTTTATKTDTPLRDIPQSIQVVPRQVLEDQNVTRLEEAIRNVPGVNTTFPPNFSNGAFFAIRGFTTRDDSGNILRNGLPDFLATRQLDFSHIEQVEVLKGPSSVLFGRSNPGGTINLITKQPLSDPFYEVKATVGNYSYYRGTVDISGPLDDSKQVLYRVNAAYQNIGSFTDFKNSERLFVAPVISWAISDRTKLTLEGEYSSSENEVDLGLPAVGTVLPNPNGRIPLNRSITEPSAEPFDVDLYRIGYTLEHKFSDSLSLRNAFRVSAFDGTEDQVFGTGFEPDNRTLNRTFVTRTLNQASYNFAVDLVNKFSTGSIGHQVIFGVDLSRFEISKFRGVGRAIAPIDVFNPVYGQPLGDPFSIYDFGNSTDALGIYVQDQVTLAENLKLLLGVRFDTFNQTEKDFLTNTETSVSGDAFSPRVGIVYQPIESVSLYANYSTSFTPVNGIVSGGSIQPEEGRQYEIGAKVDISNKLSAILAFFDLTRSNVLADDPNNSDPIFSIQTGEQHSQGIELSVGGEILPGWNIFAGYAYTDAKVSEDTNPDLVDNRLENAPENSFNLFTTYEIQQGDLKGLGIGLGFFFVGDRQGDLENTFTLPSYLRTDASIFYKKERLRAQVNFRNVFNVDYYETAFGSFFVFPGEPFTVQGTISWQF
ncbi:TonB-dependent receptor [Nostoc favosum]|uniref:TonB-dependent receptor n=1 Tax=Nostoc favosum CHAB5714 TaxID=2780399 RepID=A0ABS8I3S0_9NOSO|nr:TonB-dependent receptor [Nostoc favosum]MCC5598818.1 TonB-dependent receptor [Nostoc favosum CHAB5714]